MSRSQTVEQTKLSKVTNYLNSISSDFSMHMKLLEQSACKKSGASVIDYWECMHITYTLEDVHPEYAEHIMYLIEESGIPFSMALSSLIREPIGVEEQKKYGAFYTDYRLASLIADKNQDYLKVDTKVVDFAAGTGILLLGIAERYKETFPEQFDKWLAECFFAFDLSENALRGIAASLLTMTSNVKAIHKAASKWKVCDSLTDEDINKMSFDLAVGNPPWGKIKITRHAFSLQEGISRTYGSDYEQIDEEKYNEERQTVADYAKQLKTKYCLLEKAEPDMYMAFLQRSVEAVNDNGRVSLLVPAGLIRSQGTEALRRYLISNTNSLEYLLMDNRDNYFSIDSRFKFVLVNLEKGNGVESIDFKINASRKKNNSNNETVKYSVEELEHIRPDLTIPEVKNQREKDIFSKVCMNGREWGNTNDEWQASISREVDMTNDKEKFSSDNENKEIPVIEGRMVQQHRFGVKSYVSGSGRSAVWKPCARNGKSQFFIQREKLNKDQKKRVSLLRAGYCDIAGQTNERAMMSSIIPANVICGNKVPTVIFPNDTDYKRTYFWIGITNSFVFDWMIRRIISTTVNYFLLYSIPMPDISLDSEIASKIIDDTRKLSEMSEEYYTGDEMQKLRTEIDVLVAEAYGLTFEDLEVIMKDFSIMDRKQPALIGEKQSTITRDTVLSKGERIWKIDNKKYTARYETGKSVYAKAYIPTEMTILCEGKAQ